MSASAAHRACTRNLAISRKRELLEAATSTMHAPSWAYVNQLLRKAHESLDVDTIQQLAAVNQKLIDVLVASNNPAQQAIVEHLQTFLARAARRKFSLYCTPCCLENFLLHPFFARAERRNFWCTLYPSKANIEGIVS